MGTPLTAEDMQAYSHRPTISTHVVAAAAAGTTCTAAHAYQGAALGNSHTV
jgi:hypothetical protein